MSGTPTVAVDDEPKVPASAEDLASMPKVDQGTTNSTGRDMNGVQAGSISGGVTQQNHVHYSAPPQPELFVRRATEAELDEVWNQFVQPAEYDNAREILGTHHAVVLCGAGTGRTFAGRRLLVDRHATAVVDLNRDRELGSIQTADLQHGEGYLWDASGSGDHPFTGREFQHAAHAMRTAGCWLVVVLDHRGQVPAEASSHSVALRAPDPVEVAVAVIHRRWPGGAEEPTQILKSDLASGLGPGDPPHRAVRAADLAILVAKKELEPDKALTALKEDVDEALARSFEGWSTIEYSMLLAIALLEDQPYDEVAAHAVRLDEMIRKAELPEDKKLRPRQMFAKRKEKILDAVRAVPVLRDHPRHPGLKEETVRFIRQDWAPAALRHIWREYHVIHELLLDWMCAPALLSRFPTASAHALSTLIADVPAHEPLQLVDSLATKPGTAHRELAVKTLTRLADEHNLLPLVKQTLDRWVSGSVRRQLTAALVYGSPFGQREPHTALAQLARIGRSTNEDVQTAVVRGMLGMLSRPECAEHVLRTVVLWLKEPESVVRPDGLHTVGLELAMWVVGFYPDSGPGPVDPAGLSDAYPCEVGFLAGEILFDQQFGPLALSRLSRLATSALWEHLTKTDASTVRTKLVRIASLVAPDLRWWQRRRTVASLGTAHPAMRTEIRRIFRTARKIQHARERSP